MGIIKYSTKNAAKQLGVSVQRWKQLYRDSPGGQTAILDLWDCESIEAKNCEIRIIYFQK